MDTVGKSTSRIPKYIKNQLKEDQMGEQLTISEEDPFKGNKLPPARKSQTSGTG